MPKTPLTKREELSDPNDLASSIASLIATFGGISSRILVNSNKAMRIISRSIMEICDSGQSGAAGAIIASSCLDALFTPSAN